MILQKFDYSEFEERPNKWSVKGLVLEKINLIVGKNATGKTNTLTKIAWLGDMLAGMQPYLLNSGNYNVEFFDDNSTYEYKLNISIQKIQFEELTIDGDVKFNRKSDGKGEIYSEQFNEKMNFQLPTNRLVVTSKRDAIQHPFLEKLAKWAEGQRMYAFSKLGQDSMFLANDVNNINVNPRDMNSVVGLYASGEREFKNGFKNQILGSMKEIGYELTDVCTVPFIGSNMTLCVKEKGSEATILQYQMSQGMFRALSLIIQITYNTLKELPTTILIDDIGEGLDFARSTSVIKLISEVAENGKCQLIMSTNDRFVMNNVLLKYWQIIQREGGQCKIFNYHNSKKKFEEFEDTGLNNFDFLATDFINSKEVNE
jgi:predicted ATPase